MQNKQKGPAQSRAKAKNHHHDSTITRAEDMIGELIRSKFRTAGCKLNHGGIVNFLRRQGFAHQQIKHAIDAMAARGEIHFVLHETRDTRWVGRQSITQWRSALEIWQREVRR